jgi:endogenous inhibitor of DNA gyrase (YacG/DUF329 family)
MKDFLIDMTSFICPQCQKRYFFDKKIIFVELIPTGSFFEFCSEKCLVDRTAYMKDLGYNLIEYKVEDRLNSYRVDYA